MRILIAEDDAVCSRIMQRALAAAGHAVAIARSGPEALEQALSQPHDALLVDWMLPGLDGIEVIRGVRAQVRPAPLIMMITSLGSPEARAHGLRSGADEFLAKPVQPEDLVTRLEVCFQRSRQPAPSLLPRVVLLNQAQPAPSPRGALSPFPGVLVAASTGGTDALRLFLSSVQPSSPAAWFVALHGPGWMLETFVASLNREIALPAQLATHGMRIARGNLYIAPGNRHLVVGAGARLLELDDGPAENFVKPAADPLFRSGARAFGTSATAVLLTGMGCDGAKGAMEIVAAGGTVIAQDPDTAVAPSMPRAVIDLGLAQTVFAPAPLGAWATARVAALAKSLAA